MAIGQGSEDDRIGGVSLRHITLKSILEHGYEICRPLSRGTVLALGKHPMHWPKGFCSRCKLTPAMIPPSTFSGMTLLMTSPDGPARPVWYAFCAIISLAFVLNVLLDSSFCQHVCFEGIFPPVLGKQVCSQALLQLFNLPSPPCFNHSSPIPSR